ncbi:hypothetical protein CH369_03325 [Leptospira levettii]|uniref:HpaII family restriction endonuclease n=1 Tax=Leptospira levettii TaxID=2023178 RepID=UPI000C296564|nr:HpaII family restriction endonuclease [Leptospira levettii]PKA02204.1 hypothetical protein CH369_03325 [Leptospira levettii]TGM92053.1 HpaII family restriction endonuclease [Leptospira levettii]
MLKGNKGEWSEIYVLLKLLSEGKVYNGDENLKRQEDLFFPILKIIRNENNKDLNFIPNGKVVTIYGGKGEISIPTAEFLKRSSELFKKIIEEDATFEVPQIEAFLHSMQCYSIKAKSNDKTDIRMQIHDLRTNMSTELGFSIKSQLGAASTLLNSNKDGTNFKYAIHGLKKKDVERINSINRFYEKFQLLKELKVDVSFVQVKSSILLNNLIYIDSSLPAILGNLVYFYYSSQKSKLSELAEDLRNQNAQKFDLSKGQDFYGHKLKRFLTDVALGFTPGKAWNGDYDATGGYLIVKEDGDIICYHIYQKKQFEDYIFYNTRLDTPSSSRHEFGFIYEEKDQFFIDLNLQIRFNK